MDVSAAIVAKSDQLNAIAIHRAEVRIKMKNKRPKLRRSNTAHFRLKQYTRNNPEMKWIYP